MKNITDTESILSLKATKAQDSQRIITFQPRGLARPKRGTPTEAIRIARELLNRTPVSILEIPPEVEETLFAVWIDMTSAPLQVGQSGDIRPYLLRNLKPDYKSLTWRWFSRITHPKPKNDTRPLTKKEICAIPEHERSLDEIHAKLPSLTVTYVEFIGKTERTILKLHLSRLLDCPDLRP